MSVISESREHMIDSQILPNHVLDPRLIDALLSIPREKFVPAVYRHVAYSDRDIPLYAPDNTTETEGTERVMLEPMTFARMVQLAEPQGNENILVIGAGSGYAAAILSRLVGKVWALEEDEILASIAQSAFREQALDNIEVIIGPLEEGYAPAHPYDLVFINGGIEALPDTIAEQLCDHGRLITIQTEQCTASIMKYSKFHGHLSGVAAFDTAPRLLPGFERPVPFRL